MKSFLGPGPNLWYWYILGRLPLLIIYISKQLLYKNGEILNQQKPDPKRKIKEGKKKKKKKPNNQLNKNLTINLNNKKI